MSSNGILQGCSLLLLPLNTVPVPKREHPALLYKHFCPHTNLLLFRFQTFNSSKEIEQGEQCLTSPWVLSTVVQSSEAFLMLGLTPVNMYSLHLMELEAETLTPFLTPNCSHHHPTPLQGNQRHAVLRAGSPLPLHTVIATPRTPPETTKPDWAPTTPCGVTVSPAVGQVREQGREGEAAWGCRLNQQRRLMWTAGRPLPSPAL